MKYADVCCFNSSGQPQLRGALDFCRQGRFVGPGCGAKDVPVAALLSQEHHARGEAWVDLKAMARRAGWNMSGASAVSSHSAGAAVSVRSAYANVQTQGAKEDVSPAESQGG